MSSLGLERRFFGREEVAASNAASMAWRSSSVKGSSHSDSDKVVVLIAFVVILRLRVSHQTIPLISLFLLSKTSVDVLNLRYVARLFV